MSRKTQITAGIAVAAVLAMLIGFWIAVESAEKKSESAQKERAEAALTEFEQTPPQTLQAEPEPEEETTMPAQADAGPYNFENWEDAINAVADLVGMEIDAQIKERGDEVKDIGDYALPAYQAVRGRIWETNEFPELRKAIAPYLPGAPDNGSGRIPAEEFDPVRLAVRAGRLPGQSLKSKLTLPNGEIYYSDEKEDVAITWQRERISAEKRKALARFESARSALEARLAESPDDKAMQKKMSELLTAIERLKTPQVTRYEAFSFKGDPTHPEYKITFIDLGVIK